MGKGGIEGCKEGRDIAVDPLAQSVVDKCNAFFRPLRLIDHANRRAISGRCVMGGGLPTGLAEILLPPSRMWGNADGQIFALIVMVVAACEVVVGLGLIVAMYRNRIPIDVDEMSELRG